ncbi:ATP-binding domain-containing protein [Brevibacterium ihuae]|uniref:ATP-binding domain-containing protein n=1 Tax=Brevibacterium ihuae TaxID=1631743 RepID=UPI000C755D52|nr:ATP-binding domain-containing protein [Brevibacterium ihuae]
MTVDSLDKPAELASEQRYFDDAMRRYSEVQRQSSRSLQSVSGNAADVRAARKALKSGDKLGAEDAVAIGRVDFESGPQFYVGKSAIRSETGDMLVASWKSKIGGQFYSATPEDPRALSRKRTFRTRRNVIEDFSDLVFAQLAEEIAALDSGAIRIDDELLNSLEAGRTDTMNDIVRTIQAAQYDVIAQEPRSLLVIQGGPGTGKTAVALHRVSWLLYNQPGLRPEDVLVVGPNLTLMKYIEQVVPSLGDEGVRHAALEHLVRDLVVPRNVELPHVAQLKGDARMQHVLAEGLRSRIRVAGTALRVKRAASTGYVEISSEMVHDLIKPLSYLPYGEGRERFIEGLRGECLRASSVVSGASFEREFDAVSFNQQVDRVWPRLSPHQFLRELFGSRNRLAAAGGHELSEEELGLLYRPSRQYISDEPWSMEDAFLLHEAEAMLSPGEQPQFSHIVVDEAQDLSGMQLKALARRSRGGAMTLAGDIAQSTGPFARNSWAEIMTILEKEGVPASRQTLRHVYRVPSEILRIAVALQNEIAPQLDPAESVRSTGREPRALSTSSKNVSRIVLECAREHSADGLMVGVIAAESMFDAIADHMDSQDVRYSIAENGALGASINLVRPEAAKGLEFDAVVIADPDGIHRLNESGSRLLYIALTRATARLDLVLPESRIPDLLLPVIPEIELITSPGEGDGDEDWEQLGDGTREQDLEAATVVDAPADSAAGVTEMIDEESAANAVNVDGDNSVGLSSAIGMESAKADTAIGSVPLSLTDRMVDAIAEVIVGELHGIVAPTEVLRVAQRVVAKLDQDSRGDFS